MGRRKKFNITGLCFEIRKALKGTASSGLAEIFQPPVHEEFPIQDLGERRFLLWLPIRILQEVRCMGS